MQKVRRRPSQKSPANGGGDELQRLPRRVYRQLGLSVAPEFDMGSRKCKAPLGSTVVPAFWCLDDKMYLLESLGVQI